MDVEKVEMMDDACCCAQNWYLGVLLDHGYFCMNMYVTKALAQPCWLLFLGNGWQHVTGSGGGGSTYEL